MVLHSRVESKEAFFRMSLARLASASSARSLRFSASRPTDSAGVSVPDCLWVRTQTRRVSLLSPSSPATRVIAPRAVSGLAWAWSTSSMARCLSSGVYFEGMCRVPFPIFYPPLNPGRTMASSAATSQQSGALRSFSAAIHANIRN